VDDILNTTQLIDDQSGNISADRISTFPPQTEYLTYPMPEGKSWTGFPMVECKDYTQDHLGVLQFHRL
jgi:hypothetical protein